MEIPEDKVITMKRPILGFENLVRFCIIEREEMLPFLWLHSIEDPAVAFVVVNPVLFYPDYRIDVNPKEIAELKVAEIKSVETYAIVSLADEMMEVSINLQGPVLINTENGFAKQLVLVNSDYEIKHNLIDAVDRLDHAAPEPEPVGV
jgi:flagellar assembly factor FliW